MTDIAPLRFWLESLIRPIIREVLTDELRDITPAQLPTTTIRGNKYLTASDAAKFLGIAKQTLYQSISKVPHTKRFGKLYFLESDLTAYLGGGQSK